LCGCKWLHAQAARTVGVAEEAAAAAGVPATTAVAGVVDIAASAFVDTLVIGFFP